MAADTSATTPGARRPARHGSRPAGRRRQERSAGRPPFLHHLRHHGRGRAAVGAAARAIPRRDDHRPAASVLGSEGDRRRRSRSVLSFGGVAGARCIVPFDAIKGFADPSVQFALQFETLMPTGGAATPKRRRAETQAAGARGRRDSQDERGTACQRPPACRRRGGRLDAAGRRPAAGRDAAPFRTTEPGAEVVRLDRFRKK